jgi:hypothetical protein
LRINPTSVGDVLQIVVDIQGFDPVAFLFWGNQNYIFGPFDDHFGVALFWAPSLTIEAGSFTSHEGSMALHRHPRLAAVLCNGDHSDASKQVCLGMGLPRTNSEIRSIFS